eukprot:359849_1
MSSTVRDQAMKAMKMQWDIKNKAEKQRDFLRDVKHWEDESRKKDVKLKHSATTDVQKETMPIRGTAAFKERIKSASSGNKEKNEWENFDVGAALKSLGGSKSSQSEDEKGKISKQLAAVHKQKGNDFFKAGRFSDAIKEYTKCIEAAPSDHIPYANRAMAYLKTKDYASVERDCSKSLELNPRYVKALLRRATARKYLSQPSLALRDFKTVLKYEPSNVQALREVTNLELQLNPPNIPNSTQSTTNPPKATNTPKAPNHSQSTASCRPKVTDRRRRRLSVQDVSDSDSESSEEQQKKSRPDSPVQPERLEIQNRTKMDEPKQFFDPKPHTAKIEEISQSSKLNNRHKSEKVHKSTARSQLQAVQNSEECKGNHVPEQKYVASIDYSPPKSFSEFSRVWRSLRKRPEALGLYIKLVEPSRLPKLLRSGIDSDMFEEMIRAVHAQFYSDQPKLAFKYLVSLSEIERFDMAVMFLGSDAKSYIKEILTAVAKSLSQSEVSRVSLCYDVRLS